MATALAVATIASCLFSAPGPPEPTVAVGRVKEFLLELGPLTPRFAYPEGKVSDIAVQKALRLAITGLSGVRADEWWRRNFGASERVGLQIDCTWPPVAMPLVDVVIDELVHAGIHPTHIYVYAGDERELHRAGVVVRKNGNGVHIVGTASEGFRGGLSRVVLDYCDAIINISRLKAHPKLGLWGCLANYLVCVDYPDRLAAFEHPERICRIASRPTLRQKVRLHLLDALQPAYEPAPSRRQLPPRWPYGGVMASCDPVAIDLAGKALLEAYRAKAGVKPSSLSPEPDYLLAACAGGKLSRAVPGPVEIRIHGYEEGALIGSR